MMKRIFGLFAVAMTMLTACNEIDNVANEYSKERCTYSIDFSYGHTVTPLHDALTAQNLFCIFSTSPNMVNGKSLGYKLVSHICGEEPVSEPVTEEIQNRHSRIVGVNNGLIVGNNSLQNGTLYVFDQICPNCYNMSFSTKPGYMLQFPSREESKQLGDNVVRCPTCKRLYGLLYSGVVVSGLPGEKLMRYHAGFNGTHFWVANPQ